MKDGPEKLLYRRNEAAAVLGVSEGQLRKWERAGILKSCSVENARAKWYRASDIRSLANNIAFGRLSTEPIQTV
jgi:predicted site-specific integrase-resolvase